MTESPENASEPNKKTAAPSKDDRMLAELMRSEFSVFKDATHVKVEALHSQTDSYLRQIIDLQNELAESAKTIFELKLSLCRENDEHRRA